MLVELGYCTEKDISEALAGQAGLAYVDLGGVEIGDEALKAIPSENVQAYQVVPIEFEPGAKRLKIAMKSADNFRAVDDLRLLMGFNVEAVVADPAAIDGLIQKHFSKHESMLDVVSELASDDRFKSLAAGDKSIDLDAVLERIVGTAAAVTWARFAALGVLGEDDTITRFVTHGVGEDTIRAIGHYPAGKGLLGVLIRDPEILRLEDLRAHPASAGFPPRSSASSRASA